MNEGTINVLGEFSQDSVTPDHLTSSEHYFELSHPDASRALSIYRTFVRQTEAVVQYLSVARLHEHSTRLEIPKIKHAPTSLAASLEEYLNDKDFEINRRQYLAEREAKRTGKPTNGATKALLDSRAATKTTATQQPAAPPKPAIDVPLIDFFESISDNQQTMGQPQQQFQQYPNQTGFQQPSMQMPQQTANMGFPQQQTFSPQTNQGTNPFAHMQQQQQIQQQQLQSPQLQSQYTGAGFGGYTPQPFSSQNTSLTSIPQNGIPDFSPQPVQQHFSNPAEALQSQQTSTNPFRQSTLVPNAPGIAEPKMLNNPTGATGLNRSPTNPFAKHNPGFQAQTQSPPLSSSPYASLSPVQSPPTNNSPFAPLQQQQGLQSTATGTNPFARNPSPQQNSLAPQGGLTVHATGSTNPFRQSAFVNQQTGQGWQNSGNQGTIGGFSVDTVPTTSIFPRPGQQTGQPTGQGWS